METEIKLIKVTHQQCRFEFFKKQLDKATRSMNYHVKRKHHPYICAEKGEIVSFYEWAVKMAKEQIWIPVTERLPDKMCQCICRYVFCENTEYPFYQVLWYFTADENPHFLNEGSMGLRVTHWMPLPEPPQEEAR